MRRFSHWADLSPRVHRGRLKADRRRRAHVAGFFRLERLLRLVDETSVESNAVNELREEERLVEGKSSYCTSFARER